MKKSSLYRSTTRIATALVGVFLVGGSVACGTSGSELDVEASAAYLTAADEAEDIGADAVASMSAGDVEQMAAEEADAEVVPADGEQFAACDFSARRQAIIDNFDADGDGTLSEDERAALREEIEGRLPERPRLRRLLRNKRQFVFRRVRWAFDVDNNRVLDDTERANMIAALESRCELRRENFLENWDADNDGTISESELAAARAHRRQQLQQRRDNLLGRYDTNGDGILDRSERQAVKEDAQARWQQIKDAVTDRADTDDDGELSEAELLVLKEAIQDRIANGKPE